MKKQKTKMLPIAEGIKNINTSLRLVRLPTGPLALLVFGEEKVKREKTANRIVQMLKNGGGDAKTSLKIFTKFKDGLLMLRLDELPEFKVTISGGSIVEVTSTSAAKITVHDEDCAKVGEHADHIIEV